MAVERKPPAASVSLLKNSPSAPFIYFDTAPVRGSMNGNIEVELATRALLPKPDGSVAVEAICVGHLRCSPQSAHALIEALKQALEFQEQQAADILARQRDGAHATLNS